MLSIWKNDGESVNHMNNGKRFGCIALACIFLLWLGCRNPNAVPSVDHLDGSFELVRSEQQLWQLDTTATDAEIDALQAQHPAFWELYFTQILPLNQVSGVDTQPDAIRALLADPRLRFIADTVKTAFTDLTDIESELQRSFQFLQYYFPGNRAPNVFTLISDFGYFPFIFEDDNQRDAVGISLEMFMGADFPYRQFTGNHPAFSGYLLRTYNRDHLVKKVLDIVVDDLVGPPPGDRLLDLMIHNGKKLYILDHLMPAAPDSVVMEYTPAQLEWCAGNERNLWAHYLTEDLLYSNEFSKVNKLVNYSPNVPGMPPEAPGRVGNWTGWQIIRAWKNRDPDLSLIDIIALRDAQRILELARYKPR